MKKIKILYWVCTAVIILLFGVFSVPAILDQPSSQAIMKQLGYPSYLGPFLGVAKLLGVIAIVVPGYPRLKEWAYAGITFDLLGATYSTIMTGTPFSQWWMMLLFFAFIAGSYICYHKLKDPAAVQRPSFA